MRTSPIAQVTSPGAEVAAQGDCSYWSRSNTKVQVRVEGGWRHAEMECCQRLGEHWWANVTFPSHDSVPMRTSVPLEKVWPADIWQ